MKTPRRWALIPVTLAAALSLAAGAPAPPPDPAKACDRCEEWNRPQEPFRLHGRTYYVGTEGLGSVMVASEKGDLVLLDGGLPQSGPQIADHIRTLGFEPARIAVILNSHAHYDHAGGIAYLQRLSGARVLASAWGAKTIAAGQSPADDPQFGFGREAMGFPPARNVHSVSDGEVVRVGEVEITAHLTPGHTPGSTSWTWRSCEGGRCVDVVYADSLTAISAPGFRYAGDATHPSLVETFRASIATIAALPCDLLVTVHPSFMKMGEKLERRPQKPATDPFLDPQSCRAYAADAARKLDVRIAEESGAAPATRDIGAFFESFAKEWMRADPQGATELQYFDGAEQDALDRQLTPATREYQRQRIALARRGLDQLRAFDRQALSPEDAISYAALEWQLDDIVRGEPFLDHKFPYEQFRGVQRQLPDFFANTHPLRNARDAENYLARLEQVGPVLDAATADARALGDKGLLPPSFILDATIAQMERFAAPPAAENYIVRSFADRLPAIAGLEPARRQALVDRATSLVADGVYPAWKRGLALLREQRPKAKDDAGLWRLPQGDASYRQALRHYTTTDLSPDEIHALGLAQVARIESEMDGLLKTLGYTSGSVNERLKKLEADAPEIKDPDPRAVILADYDHVIRDAEKRCETLFDLRPQAPVVVRREPEFSEANAAAHYTAPARDGSRPGIFWAPLAPRTFRTSDVRRTLAYHEAVPGHHFQIALQQEMPGLARFRQDRVFGGLSAFSEGWGLYAEHLAAEQGWYEGDVPGRLVQLGGELMRARRLVVDTGLHAKHWTRQQVIDYGITVAETERYVVMPGQACSYMVGELRLLALRDKMKAALGDRFSLREFHNVVLRTGTVPLDVLEQVVDGARPR
jgi:uncharacterized protein (DUF885 family)/glyoxylase-like metal-dependent hydrolase (beta-lactamase superfamily II)